LAAGISERTGAGPELDFSTEVLFSALQKFDVGEVAGTAGEAWFNRTLARVNDCVLRLGVAEGKFPWHKHEQEDELFYVLDGLFQVEVEGRAPVRLGPGQGYVVPKNSVHRTWAVERSTYLMIEGSSVTPTGDN
jgi:mannose-6-phosphate isomerase-like protein (cupin superfamily)